MHVLGELKLTVLGPFRAERADHSAVDVEYLYAMVVAVGNDHAVRVGHRDVMRMFQLSDLIPVRSELADERPVRLEHLDENEKFQFVRYPKI